MAALRPSFIGLLPASVVSLDVEGRVTAMNACAATLLGIDPHEALGKLYPSVFGASLGDRVLKLFLHAVRTGQAHEPHLIAARLPSGRNVTLRAAAGPIHTADGEVIGAIFGAEEVPLSPGPSAGSGQALPGQGGRSLDGGDGEERAARYRAALERYAGPHVAAAVDERPSFVGLGGVRRTLSLLHADVRGYTTVAEAVEPEAAMDLLVRIHTVAVDVLLAGGATLDRFIGDTVLGFWNGPRPQEDHALRAVRTALDLRGAVEERGSELQYGIGLHTGEAMVGNLGSERFMNYTAVGDSVNVAARLQSAAGPTEIICSQAIFEALGDRLQAMPLGPLSVKGRAHPVEAYRVEGLRE
jgi:class 3 adenylate cyclase